MEWVSRHKKSVGIVLLVCILVCDILSGAFPFLTISALALTMLGGLFGQDQRSQSTIGLDVLPDWFQSFGSLVHSTTSEPDMRRIIDNRCLELVDFETGCVIPREEEAELWRIIDLDKSTDEWFLSGMIMGKSSSGKTLLAQRIGYNTYQSKEWDVFFTAGGAMKGDARNMGAILSDWHRNVLLVVDDVQGGAHHVDALLNGLHSVNSNFKRMGLHPRRCVRVLLVVRSADKIPQSFEMISKLVEDAERNSRLLLLESTAELARQIKETVQSSDGTPVEELLERCKGDLVHFTSLLVFEDPKEISESLTARRLRCLPDLRNDSHNARLRNTARTILFAMAVFSSLDIEVDVSFLQDIASDGAISDSDAHIRVIIDSFVKSGFFLVHDEGNLFIRIPHRSIALLILSRDALAKLRQALATAGLADVLQDSPRVDVNQALFKAYLENYLPRNLAAVCEGVLYDRPELAKYLQIPLLNAAARYRRIHGKLAHSLPRFRRLLYLDFDAPDAKRAYEDATGIRFLGSAPLGRIDTMSLNPKRDILAAALEDSAIGLLDCETGKPVDMLLGLDSPAVMLSWNPAGTHIAAVSFSGHTVSVWDIETALKQSWTTDSEKCRFLNATWSPSGSLLAIVSNHDVSIYDTHNWALVKHDEVMSFGRIFDRSKQLWSLDERLHLLVPQDDGLYFFKQDYSSPKKVIEFHETAKSHVFVNWDQARYRLTSLFFEKLSDQNWPFADAVYRNTLNVWELGNGDLHHIGMWTHEGDGRSDTMCWLPDGRTMLHIFRFWDGEYVYHTWPLFKPDGSRNDKCTPTHLAVPSSGCWVHSMEWSELSKELYVAECGDLLAYDLPKKTVRRIHPPIVRYLTASPDGNRIAIAKSGAPDDEPSLVIQGTSLESQFATVPVRAFRAPWGKGAARPFFKVIWDSCRERAIAIGADAVLWDASQEQVMTRCDYAHSEQPFYIEGFFIGDVPHFLLSALGRLELWDMMDTRDPVYSLNLGYPRNVNYVIPNPTRNQLLVDCTPPAPFYHIVDLDRGRKYSLPEYVKDVTWTPDGKGIVFTRRTSDSELVVDVGGVELHPSNAELGIAFKARLATINSNRYQPHYRPFIVSGNARMIACAFDLKRDYWTVGGQLRVWDANDYSEVLSENHESGVGPIAWSPDGSALASGLGDDLVIWAKRNRTLEYAQSWENIGRFSHIDWTLEGMFAYGVHGLSFLSMK